MHRIDVIICVSLRLHCCNCAVLDHPKSSSAAYACTASADCSRRAMASALLPDKWLTELSALHKKGVAEHGRGKVCARVHLTVCKSSIFWTCSCCHALVAVPACEPQAGCRPCSWAAGWLPFLLVSRALVAVPAC